MALGVLRLYKAESTVYKGIYTHSNPRSYFIKVLISIEISNKDKSLLEK